MIGVKRTPYLDRHGELAVRYPPLDFAERDVDLLRTALEHSDYTVEVEHEDTGRGPVVGLISDFFASCEPGDTAFLYFSCHGETVGGKDHLVLADSQAGRPGADGGRGLLTGTLLRADPGELLGSLPAGVTAVVCLDVCRVADPAAPGEVPGGDWESGRQDAFWLYSCGPGQRSYADPMEGSWFARALAKALSPTTQPTTFHEVTGYAEEELRRIADPHPEVEPPGVQVVTPLARQGEPRPDPTLCKGSRQSFFWTRTIRESALWKHTSGPEAAHERIRGHLTDLVHCVVDTCAGAGGHRADPWTDPHYPDRVEARLADLVGRAELRGDELLSPAETACLLAAAIVHEGIVALALDELHRLLPGHLDPGPRGRAESGTPHQRLVRDAARDVCRAHSLVLRTVETLRVRGLTDATAAADHWLRHRFIADWDRLWERTGDYEAFDDLVGRVVGAIEAAADSASAGPRTEAARKEIDSQVRQVLGHLTVKPGNSPRINDPDHGDNWIVSRPVRGNQWRGRELARLLWTAGLLAADPRRLPSVLVDHLGAHEPLLARHVVDALGTGFDYDEAMGRHSDRLTEQPAEAGCAYGLAVRFACPHPALHAAVEELALTANAAVRAFHADAPVQPLLRGLPHRVTTEQLRALPGRYKEPLERFRLAEDEIRPLLMGTQLYGDRMLAVRELYQNALDACRYRDMRQRYGRVRHAPKAQITLTQGWDGGRPYIECADNGAGMTRARLTSMFARAGKRYEQDPEFVLERRNWRRAGIVDQAMNSRFGIGVFSYFMLADEVVVWTHAVDRLGRPGKEEPQRADIQSGSGLLQINRCDDALVPTLGGTRVRLYLAEPREGEKRPSLIETLRSLLWVTEHAVRAVELDEDGGTVRELTWQPGVLEHREGWHGEPVPAGEDGWLVQGPGQLLLDGVRIPKAPRTFGRVVNLRERHSPVPSVDRNQLLEHDEELVLEELLAGTPAAAAGMHEVSLRWLWTLTEEAPRLAVAVLDSLPADTMATLGATDVEQLGPERLPLSRIGCLPWDRRVKRNYTPLGAERTPEGELFGWWQRTRMGIHQGETNFAPKGYPEPESLDGLLFLFDAPHRWRSVLQTAARAQVSVRRALRAQRRYAIAGIEVPAIEDIRALDDCLVDRAAADLHTGYSALARVRRSGRLDTYFAFERRSIELRAVRPPALHAPILAVSARHDLSIGEVTALLRTLRTMDSSLPEPPEVNPEVAAEKVARDETDRLIGELSESVWTFVADWLPGLVEPVDLLGRARPPFALPELARRIARLGPLGFSLTQEPTAEAQAMGTLAGEQQLLLSVNGLRHRAPWREGDLPLAAVLTKAAELQAPLGDVARRINQASAATGVSAPEVPGPVADWIVPAWVAHVFSSRPMSHENAPVRGWELILNRPGGSAPDVEEFLAAVDKLDALGLMHWDGHDREALAKTALRSGHRPLIPHVSADSHMMGDYHGIGINLHQPCLSLAHVLSLAALEDEDLGTVVDQIGEVAAAMPVAVEDLPPRGRPLRATGQDVSVLTEPDPVTSARRFRADLTVGHVLDHAVASRCTVGASLRRLREFTVLGAPAPPGDPAHPHAPAMDELRPERYDQAAFGPGLLAPGTLGPLELVLVAGRFGWSLGRTYERYAPFACLGLDVTVRAPGAGEAELVPDWRDVLVLTRRLTGRHPALTGTVERDHIALCAEETDLTEAKVRERLERYADLFSLELPDPPAAGESVQKETVPVRQEGERS